MNLEDTDLTIFRIYEPHELKNGRYPYAWDHLPCPECGGSGEIGFNPTMPRDPQYDQTAPCPTCHGEGGLDHGIKDIVREEAGHRCVRCKHPYTPGCGTWGESVDVSPEPPPSGLLPMLERNAVGMDLKQAMKNRPPLWSPCDEHCTHRGPLRYRQGEGWDWDVIDGPDAEEDWIGVAGEGIRVGHDVEASWRILTVHHLNERKFDCRWHNLVSLCQRCHLTIQRKVEMNQVWPFEHSDWFKPYAAGFYAYSYRGVELTRAEVEKDLDELLSLERVA